MEKGTREADAAKRTLGRFVKPAELLALYDRYAFPLLCAAAATLPMSLTLCYVPLIPLLLLWLAQCFCRRPILSEREKKCIVPLFFLFLVYLIGSLFGVDPVRSLWTAVRSLFFVFTILAASHIARTHNVRQPILALYLGQSITASYSMFQAAFPAIVPKLFLGSVTESGQLALTVVTAIGALFAFCPPGSDKGRDYLRAFALTVLLAVFGFHSALGFHWLVGIILGLVAFCYVTPILTRSMSRFIREFPNSPAPSEHYYRLFHAAVIPLLIANLLINLKRGPWAGVFIGASLLLLYIRPRLLALGVAITAVAFVVLPPVQQRIADVSDHFFIAGGRSLMWDIGIELSTRYPLGVGLKNSDFLQNYSDLIPRSLDHFHNNFINIVAEGGWLALACFLWWVGSLLLTAWRGRAKSGAGALSLAIGCALISWQVAGLAEYNWGDSEVRMMVFLLTGLLLALPGNKEAWPDEREER